MLPVVSQVMLNFGMPPIMKDWWIVRVSAIVSVPETLTIGIAPTIVLFIGAIVFAEFGGGLQAALRSVVTELVDQTHMALVMTVLSMSFTVSEMVAGPLMAQTFKVAMDLGGLWIRMPYIVSAMILSVGTVLLLCVPISRRKATLVAIRPAEHAARVY